MGPDPVICLIRGQRHGCCYNQSDQRQQGDTGDERSRRRLHSSTAIIIRARITSARISGAGIKPVRLVASGLRRFSRHDQEHKFIVVVTVLPRSASSDLPILRPQTPPMANHRDRQTSVAETA